MSRAERTPGRSPETRVRPRPDGTPPGAQARLAERRHRHGRAVIAVRKPGVPLVEIRLRIPFLGPAPPTRRERPCSPRALLTGAGPLRPGRARRRRPDPGRRPQRRRRRRPVAHQRQRPRHRPARAARPARPRAHRADLRRRRGRDRARPPGRAAHDRALARRRHRRGADRRADVGRAPVRARPAAARRGRGHHRRRRCASCTATGSVPDGAVLIIVGDVSPKRVLDQVEKALSAWTGDGATPRVPRLPSTPERPLLIVDRPGSVQSSMRLATPRRHPHRPAVSRAAARQPHLRRLLLLALGREHP